MSKAGRPKGLIELNINNIEKTVENVISLCSNESVRVKVLKLCAELRAKLVKVSSSSTQTGSDNLLKNSSSQTPITFDAETILRDIHQYGLYFSMHRLW